MCGQRNHPRKVLQYMTENIRTTYIQYVHTYAQKIHVFLTVTKHEQLHTFVYLPTHIFTHKKKEIVNDSDFMNKIQHVYVISESLFLETHIPLYASKHITVVMSNFLHNNLTTRYKICKYVRANREVQIFICKINRQLAPALLAVDVEL